MSLVYLNDCLYLLDYLFTVAGRTVVSQLSKLIIELDDKYDARGARLEKQMERLVNISQVRLAFEREKFEYEKKNLLNSMITLRNR